MGKYSPWHWIPLSFVPGPVRFSSGLCLFPFFLFGFLFSFNNFLLGIGIVIIIICFYSVGIEKTQDTMQRNEYCYQVIYLFDAKDKAISLSEPDHYWTDFGDNKHTTWEELKSGHYSNYFSYPIVLFLLFFSFSFFLSETLKGGLLFSLLCLSVHQCVCVWATTNESPCW